MYQHSGYHKCDVMGISQKKVVTNSSHVFGRNIYLKTLRLWHASIFIYIKCDNNNHHVSKCISEKTVLTLRCEQQLTYQMALR